MAGESVGALCLDRLGAAGDRAHAVFDLFRGTRRRLSAETTPGLLAWAAAYPPGDDAAIDRRDPPQPIVTAPGGARRQWDDPELAPALSADLGRPVTLIREPLGQQDRPATVHLTVDASLRALEDALAAPIDARRFRSNVHLALDAGAFEEDLWIGRRLRIGAAQLEVVERCERCVVPTRDPDTLQKCPQLLRWLAAERATTFGLIARVVVPAVVRPQDTASVLD